MFRTYQMLWNRLFQFIDAMIVIGSFFLAWYIKFHSGWLPYQEYLHIRYYLPDIVIAAPLFVLSNWIAGLYKPKRTRSLWQESLAILRSATVGLMVFMSFLYVTHTGGFSRAVLMLFAGIFFIGTFASHLVVRNALQYIRMRGNNKKFILLVGWTAATERFIEGLEHQPWFGYHIVGVLFGTDPPVISEGAFKKMGEIEDLEEALKRHLIDHVIISFPKTEEYQVSTVVGICEVYGIQALVLPDYFDLLSAKPRFESFAGMPLIDTRHVPLDDAVHSLLKRAIDIVFSLIVLIVLSPLYLTISFMILVSSKGPVIYSQTRLGKNRREFTIYKFRTMRYDADLGHDRKNAWTKRDDPRVTSIGRFLRATSLDEIPQFFNVLKGDMSVIGPRPEQPYFVDQFRGKVPKYMLKHRVRPGITGWAQVHGLRGDTSIYERIRYDIDYIENWSMLFDLKIAIRTVFQGFRNDNAY